MHSIIFLLSIFSLTISSGKEAVKVMRTNKILLEDEESKDHGLLLRAPLTTEPSETKPSETENPKLEGLAEDLLNKHAVFRIDPVSFWQEILPDKVFDNLFLAMSKKLQGEYEEAHKVQRQRPNRKPAYDKVFISKLYTPREKVRVGKMFLSEHPWVQQDMLAALLNLMGSQPINEKCDNELGAYLNKYFDAGRWEVRDFYIKRVIVEVRFHGFDLLNWRNGLINGEMHVDFFFSLSESVDQNKETVPSSESVDQNKETAPSSEIVDQNKETAPSSEIVDQNKETAPSSESVDQNKETAPSSEKSDALKASDFFGENIKLVDALNQICGEGEIFLTLSLTKNFIIKKKNDPQSEQTIEWGIDRISTRENNPLIKRMEIVLSLQINNKTSSSESSSSNSLVEWQNITNAPIGKSFWDYKQPLYEKVEEHFKERKALAQNTDGNGNGNCTTAISSH